ncbi:Sec-independent protein translocase subunit TatA [Streptomyces fructofermentans]|uniref:Sec-independent protein translocase protein TatA n=1 Tax=Streptomyces fructofermentans TaxID=152141 RepID=A0A918U566_9ACTN|nr:Sec-independent protein translocase subunit TatA [Streptomyces fructofermentans]GGX94212.1 Sec-independent protein translocase protein TatA [Streptomyces fructofermentans]
MFGKLGAPEILLILVVLVLLFGAKRLPGMARSLGQSLRILKSETKAMRDRDEETTPDASASTPHVPATDSPLTTVPAPDRREASAAAARDTSGPY